jgi:hypothetical protein
MRIRPFAALIWPALLAACASEISHPLTGGFFADPGQYEFFSCEQIAASRMGLKAREQELKQLIDRAEQGTGGAFVSAIAYKGDHRAVREQLQVIDATARDKKCKSSENSGSTSAVR